jgi:hypothetical protein
MPISPGGLTYNLAADNQSPEGATFSMDGGRASLIVDFPTQGNEIDPYTIVQDILGFSTRDPTRVSKLSRSLPWQHPQLTGMWATSINSFQGIQFLDNYQAAAGPASSYAIYRVGIGFEAINWQPLSDAAVGNTSGCEVNRFVIRDFKPRLDIITRSGGEWRWCNVPGLGFPPGILGSVPVSSGVITAAPAGTLVLRMLQVPHVCIYPNGGFLPGLNQENGRGLVNNATWMGFPPMTLRLEAVEPKPRVSPVAPAANIGGPPPLPPLTYDVEYTFAYTNPQIPLGMTIGGHNVFPMPPSGQNVTSVWWPITRDVTNNGTADQYLRFQSYDFNLLFNFQ